MNDMLSKLRSAWQKYSFPAFCGKLWAYFRLHVLDRIGLPVRLRPARYRRQIRAMLGGDYERVILWRSNFGYQAPLFQRPQHIARALAARRCLVIYEVTAMTERVRTLRQQEDGLWLFNFSNCPLRRLLAEELAAATLPKYLQIYSTNWELSLRELETYAARGFGLIYEYVDHLSPEIAGTERLPKNIADKYAYAMGRREVYVVATAERLRQDVIAHRGAERLALVPNGVDYAFFRQADGPYAFEAEFQSVLALGKPIVCYYGALASWFDYELVEKIAATGRYSVVLFGVKYDGSYDRELRGRAGVFFLGARDYRVLKHYAAQADILMIPFRINDVTRATSPVKLFEYMALGKPIVVTDMDECRRYRSVLIGRSHAEFLTQLERALKLRGDEGYLALLDREARENDWGPRAQAILDLLEE